MHASQKKAHGAPYACTHCVCVYAYVCVCVCVGSHTYKACVIDGRRLAGQSAVLVRGPLPLQDAAILARNASRQAPLALVNLVGQPARSVEGKVPVALAAGDVIAAHSGEEVAAQASLAGAGGGTHTEAVASAVVGCEREGDVNDAAP